MKTFEKIVFTLVYLGIAAIFGWMGYLGAITITGYPVNLRMPVLLMGEGSCLVIIVYCFGMIRYGWANS